jgi:hypothetical protein
MPNLTPDGYEHCEGSIFRRRFDCTHKELPSWEYIDTKTGVTWITFPIFFLGSHFIC